MQSRNSLCAVILGLLTLSTSAQQKTKLDLFTLSYLEKIQTPGTQLDVFIHGDVEGIIAALRTVGGSVKDTRPMLVSARLPVQAIHDLAKYDAVQRFECAWEPGHLMNDSMRVKNYINQVQIGMDPLVQGYDGEGVIVGIIDSGMDHRHPDFQDENGNTRILYYWDQTLANSPTTPQPYNYGQVWDSTAINNGSITSVDQPWANGHGSTVVGTAAGNALANGYNKGCAPKADIIMVSADFGGNFRGHVADGVKYIFDIAQVLGRPAVVNASLGSYMGSHDGKDAAGLFIDDLLEAEPGRVMVCAAGNSGAVAPYHVTNYVTADTNFTWFRHNSGTIAFEAWGDIADLANVRYSIGADRYNTSLLYSGRTTFHGVSENVGTILVDTLFGASGNRLGIVNSLVLLRGGQYQVQVQMAVDSLTYNYRFSTTGAGKFDIWSAAQFGYCNMVTAIPTVAAYPSISHYVMPDRNKHIVDSWACSDKVLTVANYTNEVNYLAYDGNIATVPGTEGDISQNSSKGPTRDERIKPDVGATGDITMSAGPLDGLASLIMNQPFKVHLGGWHFRNGGTSMASPVVTGAAALYLQKCPTASYLEVSQAIRNNTRTDAFVGVAPNNTWGYGKLDAFAALVNHVNLIASTEFCEGTTIEVNVPGDFDAYTWSNGGTTDPLIYGDAGPLSVQMISPSGCTADSDTLTFDLLPAPNVPVITQSGASLTSSLQPNYQWLLNGVEIEGEVDQVYNVTANGDYSVSTTGANGCVSVSEPIYLNWTGIEEGETTSMNVWPSPVSDVLYMELPKLTNTAMVRVYDAQGKELLSQLVLNGGMQSLPVANLAGGTYSVRITSGDKFWSQQFVKLP